MNNIIKSICILFLLSCNKPITEQGSNVPKVVGNTITLNEKQVQTAGITIGTIIDTVMSGTIHVHGRIDVPPQNLASITVPLGGIIRNISVIPGMNIKKGQSIAILEDQAFIQLQEDYLTTKARLIQAESDYKRQQTLLEMNAGSDKVLEKARADYQTLLVMKQSLAQKLKLININPQHLSEQSISRSISIPAPFTGFVTKVMVNVGRYVQPSDILFEMVNPNDIHLALKVFEKDLLSLSIGQPLQAFLNSKPEKKHDCEVILISNAIMEDGTAEVHCHFNEFDQSLVPGMFMNADIELSRHSTFALPEHAIAEYEGKNYVFISSGKQTFTIQEVHIGSRENGMIEILDCETLRKKKIVISGSYALLMAFNNVE
ncbi:MAG: efflux RND transporter periplasmic adaptor subunit [Bacteroidetes bacterium]|nr:efflux RND transporter periplasmic adaptor subunit [bacterium]NBP65871.1 efflux RND transporter periplasmic adaptor subunit [Bacteroidota bacterium]